MSISPFPSMILAVALAGCQIDSSTNDVANNQAANAGDEAERISAPYLPAVVAPLSRRDLLLAALEAASDHASGVDDSTRQRALDGKPFALRLRYCDGDADSPAVRSSFDAGSGVLRLEVQHDIDTSSPVIGQIGEAEFEAVEGFWIRKPWLLEAACPTPNRIASGADAKPRSAGEQQSDKALASAAPSLGIAQFHDETSARSNRRGDRPYAVTRQLPEGVRPGPIDLLIAGRLSRLPGGKVIPCTGASSASAPTCIISVRIDEVSLLQPSGEVLAEWRAS